MINQMSILFHLQEFNIKYSTYSQDKYRVRVSQMIYIYLFIKYNLNSNNIFHYMQPDPYYTNLKTVHSMQEKYDQTSPSLQNNVNHVNQRAHRNVNFVDQPAQIIIQPDSSKSINFLYNTSIKRIGSENQNDELKIFEKNLQSIASAMVTQMGKSLAQITKAQIELIKSQQQSQEFKNIRKQPKEKEKYNEMSLKKYPTSKIYQDEIYDGQSTFANELNNMSSISFRKSMKSINSINIFQNQQDYQFEQPFKQFLKQLKLFNQNKKEPRLLWMDIDLGQFPSTTFNIKQEFKPNLTERQKQQIKEKMKQQKKIRVQSMKEKVFHIISDIISVSFNLHYKQGVQYEKVKAYCSQNFIINFCKLVKITQMSAQQMKLIQQTLQKDMLPYLNLSYPRSEQKTVNKELKRRIDEKDIFNQNRFDIVYNSKVKMTTKFTDTTEQIMSIMNYMIKLPDQKSPDILYIDWPNKNKFQSKKQIQAKQSQNKIDQTKQNSAKQSTKFQISKTLYENFQKDMQLILGIVYSQELVDKLYKLTSQDKKKLVDNLIVPTIYSQNIEEVINSINSDLCLYDYREVNKSKTQKKQKEEMEYKQKVQYYTKFKIGRKIPSHVQQYSQMEKKLSSLSIKDSSVARILMKWTEALESHLQEPAKSLYLRDEPFRLHNQQETYELLSEKHIKKMYELYERSNNVVKQKSEQLKNNAREIFLQALRYSEATKFQSYKAFSAKNDALVGHICTLVEKSKVNHISSYLSMLIAQYKSIEQQYQWLIQDKKVQISSSPSLITLKLGDLMRCQIVSKTKEIISLYQYISLLCKKDPLRFQLVRVKDRSSTPNKDILINIFYHRKIMIEIQLAIKNDSAFLNCSDKFSHFIYEMQRSFLGPVNQICAIWSQYSPKYQFFVKKFTQINLRAISSSDDMKTQCSKSQKLNKKHVFQNEEKIFKLPFWCYNCAVFYPNSSANRKVCVHCSKVYICSVCQIRQGDNSRNLIQKEFKEYVEGQEGQIGTLFYSIDLSLSKLQVKTMIKIQINGILQVFSMKVRSTHSNNIKIEDIQQQYKVNNKYQKTSYQFQLFKQNHLILQKRQRSIEYEKVLINQIVREILRKYTLPKRLKFVIKKAQSFIKLTLNTNPPTAEKGKIITECLDKYRKNLKQIQKIYLNENELEQVSFFKGEDLPKLQNMILNNNNIKNIDLDGFNQLICLQLAHNKINSIKSLLCLQNCSKLQRLVLDHNYLTNIDELTKLQQLNFLSLENNQITNISKMKQFRYLRYLNLNANEMLSLGSMQCIKNLIELKLNKNPELGIDGVESLKTLQKLKRLHINSIQLKEKLCQSVDFSKILSKTAELKKKNSDDQLKILNSLKELQFMSATRNDLKKIPKLQNLTNLKELDLYDNNLVEIEEIKHFKNLQWLCLKKNKIISLEGLGELKNIYWLNLSINYVDESSIKYINQLENLQELGLNHNKFKSFEGIRSFEKLYQLKLKHNELKSFKGLDQLKNLDFLDIRYNKLSDLNGIHNLKILRELKISGNSTINNLKELEENQNLKILVFNYAKIHDIRTQIPKMKNLQELYLKGNLLINAMGIQKFQSLKKLDISHNSIDKFDELKSLKYLNSLSFTLVPQIKNIQDSLKDLQSIKVQIYTIAKSYVQQYIEKNCRISKSELKDNYHLNIQKLNKMKQIDNNIKTIDFIQKQDSKQEQKQSSEDEEEKPTPADI